MTDQQELRSVSQRLFALSKRNRFNLQINNLAQAQQLAADLLGITDSAGLADFCFETDVDTLVETARASGYLVLRDYDQDSKKLSYLELVAPGAKRAARKIEPLPYQELQSELEVLQPAYPRHPNPALCQYRDIKLALGNYRNRSILKMKDTAHSTKGRIIISLGDAGIGHIQRANGIISQAAAAGWGIAAFDFCPNKDDFMSQFRRVMDANRRTGDMLVQHHPMGEESSLPDGSIFFSSFLKSKEACHKVIFEGDLELLPMAELISVIAAYCGQAASHLGQQVEWLSKFATLDRVLGLLEDPKAKFISQSIRNSLFEIFVLEDMDDITYEHAEIYAAIWKKWVSPYLDLAIEHQNKATLCSLEVDEVIRSRRVMYTPVNLSDSEKFSLFNRTYNQALADTVKDVKGATEQSLVVLRVSGSALQDPLVIGMTKVFSTRGYQVLLVVDGQTQKAVLIAQKLAIGGRADCLWHTCHVKETSIIPYNLSKALAGQCLLVNKERIKEPLMLLPSI